MKQYTVHHKGRTFIRIPRNKAARAYKTGLRVLVCPCNMNPFYMGGFATILNRKTREQFVLDETGVENDFSGLVDSFVYYNCNRETGLYPAFYIPVRETQHVDHPRTEYDYSFLEA